MRWGLVPYWSKDSKIGFSTINAKAETIATSPTYREAWKHRRCLVPAIGDQHTLPVLHEAAQYLSRVIFAPVVVSLGSARWSIQTRKSPPKSGGSRYLSLTSIFNELKVMDGAVIHCRES